MGRASVSNMELPVSVQVLRGRKEQQDRWWDPQRRADRTYWRVVTRDYQVFELYQEASTGAWVLDVVQD